MSKAPDASQVRFAELAAQLSEGDTSKLPHRPGMGTGSLFVGKKMFGLLDETRGLVLKLPPLRVQELIATEVGAPYHPGTGKPLKEYVAIGIGEKAKWFGLAKEARAYMASKG